MIGSPCCGFGSRGTRGATGSSPAERLCGCTRLEVHHHARDLPCGRVRITNSASGTAAASRGSGIRARGDHRDRSGCRCRTSVSSVEDCETRPDHFLRAEDIRARGWRSGRVVSAQAAGRAMSARTRFWSPGGRLTVVDGAPPSLELVPRIRWQCVRWPAHAVGKGPNQGREEGFVCGGAG
jgi:hypothetical protein